MTLRLYNTLTREKAPFAPLDPQNVRLYVCGPTVYDLAHIGNARPVVVFDVLFRLLRQLYGPEHVTYARNITDVDDKIIAAAKERGEPIADLTARTIEAFHQDMAELGALEPTHEPRATAHIPQMVAMIERLIARGHAYAADGHVLFSVPSLSAYGRLSRRNREELIEGERVEVAPYKKDPADFVLWKPSPPGLPGWESPWGRGRPGWHIECSAMSAEVLGERFDIHGGGQDLIFPHHENEIAQSVCAATTPEGARFAEVWMHNGYVIVGGQKMSKSLGNYFTVRQLLEEGHRGEAIRLALLSGHYRQPLDITREKLGEAKAQLDRLYGALRHAEGAEEGVVPDRVLAALEDDLNTPEALAELHELGSALNKASSAKDRARLKGALLAAGQVLGLLETEPEEWFKGIAGSGTLTAQDARVSGSGVVQISRSDIERLIAERKTAREAKDFAKADAIRKELAEKGILLEDRPDGTTDWRRAD